MGRRRVMYVDSSPAAIESEITTSAASSASGITTDIVCGDILSVIYSRGHSSESGIIRIQVERINSNQQPPNGFLLPYMKGSHIGPKHQIFIMKGNKR